MIAVTALGQRYGLIEDLFAYANFPLPLGGIPDKEHTDRASGVKTPSKSLRLAIVADVAFSA